MRKCLSDKFTECRCWRKCNYCRHSLMINGLIPKYLIDGEEYPGFYCLNKQLPMCHAGDGFECIFANVQENCDSNCKPHRNA